MTCARMHSHRTQNRDGALCVLALLVKVTHPQVARRSVRAEGTTTGVTRNAWSSGTSFFFFCQAATALRRNRAAVREQEAPPPSAPGDRSWTASNERSRRAAANTTKRDPRDERDGFARGHLPRCRALMTYGDTWGASSREPAVGVSSSSCCWLIFHCCPGSEYGRFILRCRPASSAVLPRPAVHLPFAHQATANSVSLPRYPIFLLS